MKGSPLNAVFILACAALAGCASNRAGEPHLGFSVTLGYQDSCNLANNCDPNSNACFSILDTQMCERQRKQREPCVARAKSYEEAKACEAWRRRVYGPS
ncbi:MAG TPA: hypothetical protein VIN59_07125 [Alphaproteobacteria bacterium]